MIGKQLTGKNFGRCIRYLLEKEQSAVLDAHGVRNYDTKAIIDDFNAQRKLRPSLGKAVGHAVLSWSNEDRPKLTVEKMAAHAREYMEKMGITDTQYLTVLHTDRDHPHLHIVYNRVDNSGNTVSNYNLWEKNRKVCREMTERYGYHMGKGKEQVNRQALRGKEQVRYAIYDSLKLAAPKATSWPQLEKLLAKQGVTIQYKYRSGTDEVQGISFEKDGVKFKGSAIDRKFSFASLDRQLANNQGMGLNTGSMGHRQTLADQIRDMLDTHQERGHSHEPSHGLGLLDILLQPVEIVPEPEPMADAEKRRRKRKAQEAEQSRGISR
ncbi:relaxase/mobilization nuclease domain-containing protein [Parapedobacter koreensis]|uniref:Relaxase/Mobilisation nuclease domain-containing protein n=1 Tax=Parapedobacter koreensis TaxID=332977 RepID=A0A1H7P5Z4_9SPHI|nr:relaxase/mobilization nuclease domain-containing protein [Parapedobacter koreensis]SEL30768.1 Relaxase/Mobilisation nuclease domain-containing protein [Parapedobacter koreensis]